MRTVHTAEYNRILLRTKYANRQNLGETFHEYTLFTYFLCPLLDPAGVSASLFQHHHETWAGPSVSQPVPVFQRARNHFVPASSAEHGDLQAGVGMDGTCLVEASF